VPREPLTVDDARRLLADASAGRDPTGWLEAAAPDLARLAIAESERADSLRAALDAIRRAHDPDGLHTVECAANDEESACDCGLDRAAADVVAYAYEVLLGRALTTEEIADAIERGDHISPDRGEE